MPHRRSAWAGVRPSAVAVGQRQVVEAGADGVTEAEILDALDIAHSEIKKIVATIEELQEKVGKDKIEIDVPQTDETLIGEIRDSHGQALVDAIATEGKLERYEAIDKVKDEVVGKYGLEGEDGEVDEERVAEVKAAFGSIEKDTIRKAIAVDKKRPDGRAQDEIRPIETEVDISPRTHGSALFTRGDLRRGETVLVIGGSGGVATVAIALAGMAGACVLVTTSSEQKLERAIELGASAGVLSGEQGWPEQVLELSDGGVDLVLDSVGSTWQQSLAALRGANHQAVDAVLFDRAAIGTLAGVEALRLRRELEQLLRENAGGNSSGNTSGNGSSSPSGVSSANGGSAAGGG